MEVAIKKIISGYLIFAYLNTPKVDEEHLKLVNVVFRHGDRSPDNNGLEMYPNDPYLNYSFEPMKRGGLTNTGKLREYQLGEYLRYLYGDFLGETYYPDDVSARSTYSGRAKMSLQLVLAALYPPKNNQRWNNQLDWQPIPINYVPKLYDNLMVPEECPKYLKARAIVEGSPEVENLKKPFEGFMKKLSKLTGKLIENTNDMYFLYHTLMAEKSMNLKLPKWTEYYFPYGKLLDGTNLEYEIASFNTQLKKLNGGMLLRRIIENMKDSISGSKRKISLYSGHETNIAALLETLGVYTPHVPEYSSAVIIELYEKNSKHFVRVKYYKGIPKLNEPKDKEMTIPRCPKNNCTLERFEFVLKKVIPSDEDIKCNKRDALPELETEMKKRKDMTIPSGIIKQIRDEINKANKIEKTLH